MLFWDFNATLVKYNVLCLQHCVCACESIYFCLCLQDYCWSRQTIRLRKAYPVGVRLPVYESQCVECVCVCAIRTLSSVIIASTH